jgi:hypothetical protein
MEGTSQLSHSFILSLSKDEGFSGVETCALSPFDKLRVRE